MTRRQMQNESRFLMTMGIARKMLSEGIISKEDYGKIDTMFTNKYRPSLGTLFSDISLMSLEDRGNMDSGKEKCDAGDNKA